VAEPVELSSIESPANHPQIKTDQKRNAALSGGVAFRLSQDGVVVVGLALSMAESTWEVYISTTATQPFIRNSVKVHLHTSQIPTISSAQAKKTRRGAFATPARERIGTPLFMRVLSSKHHPRGVQTGDPAIKPRANTRACKRSIMLHSSLARAAHRVRLRGRGRDRPAIRSPPVSRRISLSTPNPVPTANDTLGHSSQFQDVDLKTQRRSSATRLREFPSPETGTAAYHI
jgi:hypothetical protein